MTAAWLWLRVQDEVARYLYVASNGGVLAIVALAIGALVVVLIVGVGVVVLARVLTWARESLPPRSGRGHDAPAPPSSGYRLRRSIRNARISL